MKITKEYTLLFNTITDIIEEVEESICKSERLLRMLKRVQQQAEEASIADDCE